MRTSALALTVVALASTTLAEVFITTPIATTTCTAGSPCNIAWDDRNGGPTLADVGLCYVGLYVGSVQQQTLLQEIAPNVNVATTSSIAFVPDTLAGPNESIYFIRFTSLTLKNAAAPTMPYQAFSAKFTLTGMTGVFNSTVLQQIAGQTGSTPTATGGASASASNTATTKPATTTGTQTRPASTTGSPTASNRPGAASPRAVIVGGAQALVGAAVLAIAVAMC